MMFASKVSADLRGRVDLDSLRTPLWGFLQELPPFLERVSRAGQLKIINIDNQENLKSWVEIAAAPRAAFDETFRQNMAFAVLLPIAAGVRVAIERQDQRAYGIPISGLNPFIGPLVPGQENPGRGASELRLGVRLFRVSLLDVVSLKKSIGVSCLTCLHGGRAAGKFLSLNNFLVLLANV